MLSRFKSLFSSPFSPDSTWGKWLQANRKLLAYTTAVSVLSLAVAVAQMYVYYRYGNLATRWQWLYLPIGVLGAFWYATRYKTMAMYDAFLQEVEKRQQAQTPLELSEAKHKVIRQHHRVSSWYVWKMACILGFGTWAYAYIHQEFKRMSLKEPVRLSVQYKQSVRYKQKQMAKLVGEYCEMYASLRHHQARVTALKRTKSQTQASVQEQWSNYYQGLQARSILAQAQGSPAEMLRQNESVFQMMKGQTEIYLFLQNKEAQASSAILSQDDRLLSSFQDVQQRYDQHLHTAQKSMTRDQTRVSGFDEEIKQEQKIVERLMVAIANNKRLREKLLWNVQKDSKLWLERLAYEKRIDDQQKTQKGKK